MIILNGRRAHARLDRIRKALPIAIREECSLGRAVVVLDSPSTRLRLDHFDALEVLEYFDVVADLAQALFELLREFVGARHPLVENGQDFDAQRVRKRLYQALIDAGPLLFLGLRLCGQSDSSFRFRKLEPLHHIGRKAEMTTKKRVFAGAGTYYWNFFQHLIGLKRCIGWVATPNRKS